MTCSRPTCKHSAQGEGQDGRGYCSKECEQWQVEVGELRERLLGHCPEGVERRHLEMMAATIVAGLLARRGDLYGGVGGFGALVEDSASLARAIQAEVAKGDASDG